MKKSFFAIAFLLAATVLFAEGNFNLKFGADAASSITLRPLAGVNVACDYAWNSGLNLGLGIKEYWNITHKSSKDLFSGGPYFSAGYKYVTTRVGIIFTEGFGNTSLYLGAGGEIPICS
ncbi:MAG: hypothetical protein K6A43_06810 [Treponema sp.]|nr:hypothetical protein [Treponema sp.]